MTPLVLPPADARAEKRALDRQKSIDAVNALQTTKGWQNWLLVRRHFHRYSFSNQILIAIQCPHARRVAGFRAWLKLGYCVRKGEQAIRIWVPMSPSKRQLAQWVKAGSPKDDRPRTWFKLGPVFDRSQVMPLPEGDPVPLDPPIVDIEGDELDWMLTSAKGPLPDLLADLAVSVEVQQPAPGESAHGYYQPSTQKIVLYSGHSPNAMAATLVHELAHALVRLDTSNDDPKLNYASEELIVESVAYTVTGALGIDTSSSSIPYLASWSEKAGVDSIEAHAKLIDRLARRIETAVLPTTQPEAVQA